MLTRSLKAIAAIIAITKFVAGPAIETHIMSFLGFLKLFGLTGTGFAHPIILVTMKANVPTGSRCFNGLSVSLPSIFAVGSPNL